MRILFILLAVLAFAGCSVSDSKSTNDVGDETGDAGDAGGIGDDTGGTQNVEVDYFEVTVEEIPEVSFYYNANGVRGTPCRYDPESNTSAWIHCVIDVDELDAFNNNWVMKNTAPGEICNYRGFRSYYYAIANVEYPPNYVSYIADPDTGVATNVYYYYGVVPDETEPDPTVDGTTIRNPPASMLIATSDDVLCPYDYSNRWEDGKNCCKGQYQALVFNALDLAAPGNYLEASEWGGNPTNCFHGPGMEDSLEKTANGWPAYFYTKVEGAGFQDTYSVLSPNEKRDSQIYLVNYFNPAVHAANSNSPPGETNVPVAIRPEYPRGFPFYRYDCLDEDDEVVARIDVQFREWNVQGQIAVAAGAGDPDQRGVEATPFGAECKNDFFDWDDLVRDTALADGCYSSGLTNLLTDDNWLEGEFIVEDW